MRACRNLVGILCGCRAPVCLVWVAEYMDSSLNKTLSEVPKTMLLG